MCFGSITPSAFSRFVAVAGKRRLKVRIVPADAKIALEVVRRVRKMFDLGCDPTLIAQELRDVPLLATLCRPLSGFESGSWLGRV